MNLTTTYPRSVKEKLAGYVHLGRMIDKCRSVLAKTQGEYVYPCPMDQRLLEFAGVTADQFLRAVEERPNDEAVVEWFLKTATPHGEADIDAWNAMMLSLGPDTEDKWSYFTTIRDAVAPHRADIMTWADLLDLEERRPVPNRGGVHR